VPQMKVLDFLIEPGPPLQIVRIRVRCGEGVEARAAVAGPRRHALVVGSCALRVVDMPGQIKQLAA
jgi:hypothetical protein